MDVTQTPANSVKDSLSNRAAGRKRKNTTVSPEPFPSPNEHRRQETLSELATRARERRERIREIITDINGSSDQHFNSGAVDPFPRAVDKLSDLTFEHTLPFPFVGFSAPVRFKVDTVAEGNWAYVGRTKFRELLQELKKVRESAVYSKAWLYGTQGYGKSHLLAALVCYLAAQNEHVVYLPDCREFLQSPVEYVQAAMLFAWADDVTTQTEIMALDTDDEVREFLRSQKKALFVIDQMNALKADSSSEETKGRAEVHKWLMRFISGHKAVLSSSANYTEYLAQSVKQSSNSVLRVYGGLTEVSHLQIYVTMRLLTRLDGNVPVVEAT